MNERIKDFYNKLKNDVTFSSLIKYYDYGNCVEFVVNRWGDICTYRVYKNGEITER